MTDPATTARAEEEEKRKTRRMPAIRPDSLLQDVHLEHATLSGAKFVGGELILEVPGHSSPYRVRSYTQSVAYGGTREMSTSGVILRNGLPAEKSVVIPTRGDRQQRFDLLARLEEHPEILAQIVSNPAYHGKKVSLHTLLEDNPYLFDPTTETLTVYGEAKGQQGLVTLHSTIEGFREDKKANDKRPFPRTLVGPSKLVAYGDNLYRAYTGRFLVAAQTGRERFAEFGIDVLTSEQYRNLVDTGKIRRRDRLAEFGVDVLTQEQLDFLMQRGKITPELYARESGQMVFIDFSRL
jgi:hypothetical protein